MIFMDDKGKYISFLNDDEWLSDLSFMVDMTKYLSDLNIKLQGKDQLIHQLYEQVKIFIQKLQLLEKHLSFENITHFATILSRPQETINYDNYKNMVNHLREEFEKRL